MVRLEVFSRIAPSKAKEVSDEELQRMLHEAWKRVEEERKRQMEELEKFVEKIVKGLKEMGLK